MPYEVQIWKRTASTPTEENFTLTHQYALKEDDDVRIRYVDTPTPEGKGSAGVHFEVILNGEKIAYKHMGMHGEKAVEFCEAYQLLLNRISARATSLENLQMMTKIISWSKFPVDGWLDIDASEGRAECPIGEGGCDPDDPSALHVWGTLEAYDQGGEGHLIGCKQCGAIWVRVR